MCMYEYYRIVWYWEISTFYWMKMMKWCAARMSVTPLETCLLWHVWFWVDADGTRPLYQSSFGHLLVNLDLPGTRFCRVSILGRTRRYHNE